MADKQHEHDWFEEGRYIPYTDRDFDARYSLVEPRRDADGRIEKFDEKAWEAPKPYVAFRCQECHEVKRVNIPKKAYDRLVKHLETGEVSQEHLSQLPLGELIPEMAEHQARGSGASRVPAATDDE